MILSIIDLSWLIWLIASALKVKGENPSLTCLWVTLRTSPTYMMRPWCRTIPTVMESSHTSDATYLSTWMPKSFSTSRPGQSAEELWHNYRKLSPSVQNYCIFQTISRSLFGPATDSLDKLVCSFYLSWCFFWQVFSHLVVGYTGLTGNQNCYISYIIGCCCSFSHGIESNQSN